MQRTLGLMAKQPVPGNVKQRLAAVTSPEWAAKVYEAFLLDQLDRFQILSVRRVLVYDPPEAKDYFTGIAGDRYQLTPQVGGDLGARMRAFFEAEFAAGMRAAVLIGTDSPTLPETVIAQAFAELARADAVLGPATDGGYYLMGLARLIPQLFEEINWGTKRVLEQTIAQLQKLQLQKAQLQTTAFRLAMLPPWYDVDTIDDWQCLRGHVAAMKAAGLDPRIPRTEILLNGTVPGNPVAAGFSTAKAKGVAATDEQ